MPMRLLHVGTGVRGRQWLEVVRDYPDARSVALINPDARALAEAQRIIGTEAPVFGDLEEALGRVAADAALIASPSVAHADQAVRCLEAGLHVMVEKPLSMTVSDGLRVIEAADRAGRHAMVAENFRFFQTERTVRRWIDEGRLGAIHTVSCVDRRRQPPEELGRFAASLPAPQLVEIAVHHFDSFRYLFGRRQ
jgi:predicted dehydrogenase